MALQIPTINTLFNWLTEHEPAISNEDTQILANVGDIAVARYGRGFFVGTVAEIYQDSDGDDWLTLNWYGQQWNVMDDSIVQIIRN